MKYIETEGMPKERKMVTIQIEVPEYFAENNFTIHCEPKFKDGKMQNARYFNVTRNKIKVLRHFVQKLCYDKISKNTYGPVYKEEPNKVDKTA